MKKLARDPQESDPETGPLITAALREAAEIVDKWFEEKGYGPNTKGRIPKIWKEAAKILRERHGIEWKNPTQMNPGFRVD